MSETVTYKLDPSHSSAEFKIRHMMIANVRGRIAIREGTLHLDPASPVASRVEAVLDVASIDTGEAQRDGHLRSPDFFDAEKFPTIRFASREVKKDGDSVAVRGDLTIRDVTREVVLSVDGPSAPAKDPWGNLRVGATATTKIRRSDFGLTWNSALEAGGVLVGDDVSITVEVQFLKV